MNDFNNPNKNIRIHINKKKMKAEIINQKINLHRALNWLGIIKICDKNIFVGYKVDFYKDKKEAAVKAYADVMASLLEDAIELSNINFENFSA
jgi:hypothetical protein